MPKKLYKTYILGYLLSFLKFKQSEWRSEAPALCQGILKNLLLIYLNISVNEVKKWRILLPQKKWVNT